MKRLYFRPAGPSRRALLGLAGFAIVLLFLVEFLPRRVEERGHAQKLTAARLAERAATELRAERVRRGLREYEPEDRMRTGLLGPANTEITTTTGSLPAKRTTTNPNFTALIVDFLQSLQIEPGGLVAVGCSGSFPALNVAVYAAVETLELEALVIASAAASDYGASLPSFTWLDMERALQERGIFRTRTLAASVGGIEDQGRGLGDAGLELLWSAIDRNGLPRIVPSDFTDSLEQRMKLYDAAAAGRPIRAYINVGGGTVSVGRSSGKAAYRPGLNHPSGKAPVDSIIGRFLDRGVPVVHLSKIEELARRFGLPVDPEEAQKPGDALIFGHREPNRILVLGALIALGAALIVVGQRARARAHLATLPEGVQAPAPQPRTERA